MAASTATTIKCLKAIGTYAESELAEAVCCLDLEQQNQLSALTRLVHQGLKGVNTDEVERKKTKSICKKPTQPERL